MYIFIEILIWFGQSMQHTIRIEHVEWSDCHRVWFVWAHGTARHDTTQRNRGVSNIHRFLFSFVEMACSIRVRLCNWKRNRGIKENINTKSLCHEFNLLRTICWYDSARDSLHAARYVSSMVFIFCSGP